MTGTFESVEGDTVEIEGEPVDAIRIDLHHDVTGDLSGTWDESLWLDPTDWTPLRIERMVELNGLANFTENSQLELASCTPRRDRSSVELHLESRSGPELHVVCNAGFDHLTLASLDRAPSTRCFEDEHDRTIDYAQDPPHPRRDTVSTQQPGWDTRFVERAGRTHQLDAVRELNRLEHHVASLHEAGPVDPDLSRPEGHPVGPP